MKQEKKVVGIKADGTRVDSSSPDFRVQEFVSVDITEYSTREEVYKNYPELFNNL